MRNPAQIHLFSYKVVLVVNPLVNHAMLRAAKSGGSLVSIMRPTSRAFSHVGQIGGYDSKLARKGYDSKFATF